MVTPWEIYWVLQLDSINNAISSVAILSTIAALALWFIGICFSFANPDEWFAEENKASSRHMLALSKPVMKWALRITLALVTPSSVLCAFLPSTSTMAAMIVAPKIINSPTVQHEAGDLYKLAKQALENAVSPKKDK